MDESEPFVKTDLVIRIDESIQQGEENAIKNVDLALKVGRNERTVRMVLADMCINGGYVIVSSSKGIFKPKDVNEYKKWANYMMSYIQDISHRVKMTHENAKKLYGENAFQEKLPLKFN